MMHKLFKWFSKLVDIVLIGEFSLLVLLTVALLALALFFSIDNKLAVYKMTNDIHRGMTLNEVRSKLPSTHRTELRNDDADNRINRIIDKSFADYDKVISVRNSGIIVYSVCFYMFKNDVLTELECGCEQPPLLI